MAPGGSPTVLASEIPHSSGPLEPRVAPHVVALIIRDRDDKFGTRFDRVAKANGGRSE
jgi:hypothetical protein